MLKWFIATVFALSAIIPAEAQTAQQCICAGTGGCKVASGSWPNDANVPTACNIYKAGVKIASGAIVASSSIATSNASVCSPADPTYSPGPAGSVACLATIPTQAAGTTVALTVRGVNSVGEGPDGTVLSFQSVSGLPTAVPAAASVRVTP